MFLIYKFYKRKLYIRWYLCILYVKVKKEIIYYKGYFSVMSFSFIMEHVDHYNSPFR